MDRYGRHAGLPWTISASSLATRPCRQCRWRWMWIQLRLQRDRHTEAAVRRELLDLRPLAGLAACRGNLGRCRADRWQDPSERIQPRYRSRTDGARPMSIASRRRDTVSQDRRCAQHHSRFSPKQGRPEMASSAHACQRGRGRRILNLRRAQPGDGQRGVGNRIALQRRNRVRSPVRPILNANIRIHVPVNADVHDIQVIRRRTRRARHPLGVKALGEIASSASPPSPTHLSRDGQRIRDCHPRLDNCAVP